MNILMDRGIATLLFVPGTVFVLGVWLDLFPVHPLASLVAFPAMVFGGLGLAIQHFFGSGS